MIHFFSTSLLVHDMRSQSVGIHLWKNMIDRGLGMSVAFFCCIVLEPSIIWWIMRIFNAISRNLYCLSFCTCNKCALSWSFSFLRLISQSAPSTTWFCWTSFKLIRLECRPCESGTCSSQNIFDNKWIWTKSWCSTSYHFWRLRNTVVICKVYLIILAQSMSASDWTVLCLQ